MTSDGGELDLRSPSPRRAMDEIESYEPPRSEIVESEPGWAVATFVDALPRAGEAVAIHQEGEPESHAVARNRLGNRNVRLTFLDDREIPVGARVERTERPAGLSLESEGGIDLRSSDLRPERTSDDRWFPLMWGSPSFSELVGTYPALEIGIRGIDLVAPVASGGTNLVIDCSAEGSGFRTVVDRAVASEQPTETIAAPVGAEPAPEWVDQPIRAGDGDHAQISAIRTAVALGASRRQSHEQIVVALELPPPHRTVASEKRLATSLGYGDIIDRLASGLASTVEHRITTIVSLPIPNNQEGLGSIVETLDVGDVESQIFVDTSGRFDPRRSHSDAERTPDERRARDRALRNLERAEQAEETSAIFGERELSEEDRRALERAESLQTDLSD